MAIQTTRTLLFRAGQGGGGQRNLISTEATVGSKENRRTLQRAKLIPLQPAGLAPLSEWALKLPAVVAMAAASMTHHPPLSLCERNLERESWAAAFKMATIVHDIHTL